MNHWFKDCYSRLLLDNHISEDALSFMTKFDPKQYVAMVKKAGVDSAMIYAGCHNGNCYYPTRVGHMHKNLKGRDIFGETVKLVKKEGIVPIAYYSVIYHNHSAKKHPSWRTEDINGNQHSGRYWTCCPNNLEYREFTKKQIKEIIIYDIEGIFIDMTFWPVVCVCQNCRKRYLLETGKEIPAVINWHNERWVMFQRLRERWMAEFAQGLTSFIKEINPRITVTHQFSPVLAGWALGQSPGIALASDYTSGDFYGDKYQHSLANKVLASFSRHLPYEFFTSRCVNLSDHTTMKSEEEMVCSAGLILSNGGAFIFIDAINPDGTLLEDVYNRLGKVNEKVKPFKEKIQSLKPMLIADTGIYFSMYSHVNINNNGQNLKSFLEKTTNMDPLVNIPSIREIMGTSMALIRSHIPYRIITDETVDFSGIKTIIVNNAAFMSEAEVERLRLFVKNGGTLMVTGLTSLYNLSGKTSGDFALKDVFGVSFTGKETKRVNYLVFPEKRQFILCDLPSPLVRATSAVVLGYVSQPLFDPDDIEHYASIHSNPPGSLTKFPGLTINRFGKGRCIYLYSSLLALPHDAQQSFGRWLFKKYKISESIYYANLPSCVEITLLKSTTKNSYLLCFVNYQKELPNLPVFNILTTVILPNSIHPQACYTVSNNKKIEFKMEKEEIIFELSCLETMEMIEIRF